MIKRVLLFTALGIALGVGLGNTRANALSSSDFKAGRIIDDSIFFNGTSITPGGIQEFLNAKVPVCDTNHPSSNPENQPPFTCLKDFRQDTSAKPAEPGLCNAYPGGNKSAAEIIYEVGVSCGVSQRALIVLLEKEQSLITDDWPWTIQYRSATGYGCPDTAPCDAEYYGFFNQVYNAARQFKRYARDESLFRYRAYRDNYIQYNPNAACGGTNVYIENQATAGLYNYTPYQPNPSALANLYGSGDGCGAYGNRNFWRLYNDWFGPTTNTEDYWILVRHPIDGRYFIATNFAVHYVPNQQTMNDWGIGTMQPVTVTTGFITSRTYGSPLNRLLRDKWGNIFLMDGGKRHYVRDSKYLSLWQQDINSAITIHGLSNYVADGDWLGYCAQSLTTPTNVWLMNGNKRLSINDTGLQTAWGCGGSQTTRLTDSFINGYTNTGTATRSAVSSTNKKLIPDQGQLWTSSDQQIVEFYIPSGQTPVTLDTRLEQLLGARNLTLFAQNISTGQWFLIENGKRHYIVSSKMANLWGFTSLSPLSNSLLSSLTAGNDLSAAARTTTPNKYYAMGGLQKHYLPNQTAIDEWLKPGTVVDIYANNFLDRYPEGNPMNTAVGKNDATGAYFLAQSGGRLAIWNMNLYDAWGAATYVPISSALLNYMDNSGVAPSVARDGTTYYYLEASVRYPVPTSLNTSWALNQAVSILPQTLSRYSLSPTTMTPYVRYGGRTFSLANLVKTELSSSFLAIVPPSQITTLQRNYFSETFPATTHLLRSTVPADGRLWLVTTTGKIQLPTTAHAFNLGYISKSIGLSLLSPESLDAIPTTSGNVSFLLLSPSGAFKLVSFGEGLGMPNGDTIDAYAAITGSVTRVSQEIFNLFPVSRYATRLIRDDAGKVYWIEGGKKRWILNGSLLNTTFNGIPQTYLHGTVTTLIPDGTAIN